MPRILNIAGRLHTIAEDGVLVSASELLDESKNKKQSVVNADVDSALADRYTKSEVYTKQEVNSLVSPNQNYVTVAEFTDLPVSGATDTIYRVSSWDGSLSTPAVDVTKYSEYAWDDTDYVFLCVKTQIGEVYDISAANSGTKYADLAEALGTNGANVPVDIRRGGMSIKFVQNSDNKYVQYRCMAQSFTTDVTQWQGVDDELIENSNNLITSGAVEKKIGNVISKIGPFSITDTNGYIGVVVDNDGLKAKDVYIIVNGELIPISNIAKYIKTSSGFYVCDESGYILFGIRNNGSVIGKSFNDFCKTIELRGTAYNVVNNKITIPNSAIQIEYAAKLSLPKKINMLQEHVYNLYYEQMLGYGFIKDYKVSVTSLPYYPLYYSFLHNSNTVGNTTKTIRLWNGFGYKLEEKSLIINTVNKDTAGSLKICVIGDSMTENPKKLLELANLAYKDPNFNITFLGAQTSTGTDSEGNTRTIKHCAYSGRNIVDVCQLESYGTNKPNIFFDNTMSTTNKFSISKGITAMGDVPDVIIIDHGANQAVVDWNTVKGCYDFIINDIAAYNTAHNTDIKVVICVQQPGGLIDTINIPLLGSKWGRDYAPTKLMDYVNEYDDRENEGIFLLPQYLIIDPYKDYPRTDAPYSERNTSLREIALDNVHMGINMNSYSANHAYSYGEICTDGNDNGYISLKNNNTEPLSDDKVHWAKTKDDVNAGYWKLADIYFAELKYIAGL